MSDWPEDLTVDPIGTWPGALTPVRLRSNFSASWSATLSLLRTELRQLGASNERVQLAIPASQFKRDGKPYANAKAEHPGVILTLDSKHGALSYPCDTFTTWRDNVRAIAKSLENLRAVDRYGVTKRGEQYRGFLALEATAAPAGFSTAAEAEAYLRTVSDIATAPIEKALRRAQWNTHPDQGGDPSLFQRVSLAEARLREAGRL